MSKKQTKIVVKIVMYAILMAMPFIYNMNYSYADNNAESEFSNFISKYDSDDIIAENGISIQMGETLDLSKYSEWEMSNNDTVEIDENGILTPISEGTVFLSNKLYGKNYILEVNVFGQKMQSSMLMMKSNTISNTDRNYYKVFIDPGHGGSDPGNVSYGINEKTLNLQISKLIEQKLKAKNVKIDVRMSRTTDVYLTLNERATLANQYGADVFVSIHNNAVANAPTASGIETFYHTNKTGYKPLASEIQTNSVSYTGAKNRGVKSADFGVLRMSNMPSALFEAGFMTNQTELKKLADPAYQNKLASAIADGIEEYLIDNIDIGTEQPPTEPPTEPSTNKTGIVTTSSLNVRSGAGTSYGIIGSLSEGTKVEIVDSISGWYKIKYNNGFGYVSSSYIKIEESISDGWLQQNGKWYYYKDGNMYKGWLSLKGKWYYLKSDGVMATGWQLVEGKWYYLDNSGAMLTGWQSIEGKWYYLEKSGVMLTGWQSIEGKWYYLDNSGAMLTGWQKIGVKWYYLDNSGAMLTGWQKVDGEWYYLEKSGAMLTGWQAIDGEWYYLYSSGRMAKNVTIDGWVINDSGVAKPIK